MFYLILGKERLRLSGDVCYANHKATATATRAELQRVIELLGDGFGDVAFDIEADTTKLAECYIRSPGPPMKMLFMRKETVRR